VARHSEHPGQPARTLLLGVAADPQQAARARAEGADLVDTRGATAGALAAIRASLPGAVLWDGPPTGGPVDVDRLAVQAADQAGPGTGIDMGSRDPAGAVIAAAAICTWLGAPLVRSRHTAAVRQAIDMTESIAGRRPPARTVRGLA
jgi:hypothetical protein